MSTTNESDPSQPEPKGWSFEKFSEPRTFPAQWDLTEIMLPADTNREAPGPAGATSESAGPDETSAGEKPSWERNKFPQPRTYPKHWNLSG